MRLIHTADWHLGASLRGHGREWEHARVLEALGKMKSNVEASRLLVRMIIAVASSDGNFDANEQRVASKIARELGLTPAEFELQ